MTDSEKHNTPEEELTRHLGRNEDFFPTESESANLLARIDQAVEQSDQPRFSWPIGRIAAVAASILLWATTGLISYQIGSDNLPEAAISDSNYANYDPISGEIDNGSQTEIELDSEQIDLLLYEFSSGTGIHDADELLLQLTEEEIKHLEQSLGLGDIL
ncbi:MAG: hypothetical protein V3T31_06095 [candidate division Zixibacteria bacterium]